MESFNAIAHQDRAGEVIHPWFAGPHSFRVIITPADQ